MSKIRVYFNNGAERVAYDYNAVAIHAGKARDVLGEADAVGNGIPLNKALIQIEIAGGETATFDADHIYIALL